MHWVIRGSQKIANRKGTNEWTLDSGRTINLLKGNQLTFNAVETTGGQFRVYRQSLALKNGKPYQSHLGGNVYCTVRENNPCVDIRQFWKPDEEIVPCKKGLCLRPGEYQSLKRMIPDIGAAIPELSCVVPCQFQSDHANQLGFLRCSECNPNDYTNW